MTKPPTSLLYVNRALLPCRTKRRAWAAALVLALQIVTSCTSHALSPVQPRYPAGSPADAVHSDAQPGDAFQQLRLPSGSLEAAGRIAQLALDRAQLSAGGARASGMLARRAGRRLLYDDDSVGDNPATGDVASWKYALRLWDIGVNVGTAPGDSTCNMSQQRLSRAVLRPVGLKVDTQREQ